MKKKVSIKKIFLYAALMVAALTFIYPFIWMIGASLAPQHEVGKMTLWPDHPGFGNFKLMTLETPGHSNDSLSFFEKNHNILFPGIRNTPE